MKEWMVAAAIVAAVVLWLVMEDNRPPKLSSGGDVRPLPNTVGASASIQLGRFRIEGGYF